MNRTLVTVIATLAILISGAVAVSADSTYVNNTEAGMQSCLDGNCFVDAAPTPGACNDWWCLSIATSTTVPTTTTPADTTTPTTTGPSVSTTGTTEPTTTTSEYPQQPSTSTSSTTDTSSPSPTTEYDKNAERDRLRDLEDAEEDRLKALEDALKDAEDDD